MRLNPFVLLIAFILFAAALTWVLPAGRFERRLDAATGRNVVVPGSYHAVEPAPVGPFQAVAAVHKGMVNGAELLFLVFIAGGALGIVDRTGALRHGVEWLAYRLQSRERLVIPLSCVVFAAAGVVEGFWEETIALVPVLLLLVRRVGFDTITAIGMSMGAAGVGAAFSPMNPFGVGIAQKMAELPLLSGWQFRVAVLIPAVAIWTWGTMRHAARTRTAPEAHDADVKPELSWGNFFALLAFIGVFPVFAVGVVAFDWDLGQMAAAFLLMGAIVGLSAGLGVQGTTDAFFEGARSMAFAALVLGVARGVSVVLDDGRVLDTIVDLLVRPLVGLPATVFAGGVSVVQSLLTGPVPSSSGRVVLTMPILVPMSDLLGLSRQALVTATQYWSGMLNQFLPTDGALMAVLTLAGIQYQQWLRFCLPLCAVLMLLGFLALSAGIRWNLL
jgi:uncharacterized ion transporter superfamily protein YfcC